MLTHDDINDLLLALPTSPYKRHLEDTKVELSKEMAGILGVSERYPLRILESVVNAIASKLFTQSITSKNGAVSTALEQWKLANAWDLFERELWKAVVRDGCTYALARFTDKPEIHQIDAFDGRAGAYVIYETTRKPLFAINTWYIGNTRYLDVYYPNRIEKYICANKEWTERLDAGDEQWPVDWTDASGAPLGIALIELTIGKSDLAGGVIQTQRDINEALLDLLGVSRTMGFPQRYIRGPQSTQALTNNLGQPVLGINGLPIQRTYKPAPGAVMLLQADEDFNQVSAATPDIAVLDKLLHILSLQTTVPTFYFTGDFPSGVALIQAESRLNTKVEEHQGYLSQGLLTLFRTMLRLSNVFGRTAFDAEADITITWYPPQVETEDLRLEKLTKTAQAVTTLVGAGVMSIDQAVRLLHPTWDEAQIADEVNRVSAQNRAVAL